MDTGERTYWSMELTDVPGHSLLVGECAYPDSIDGGWDIATPLRCDVHGRTLWWCLNVAAFWCDGLGSDDGYHLCTATWSRRDEP